MVEELVRRVLADNAGLQVPASELGSGDDLYARGMTSHASVRVMLALEDEIGVEIPDRFLAKSSFASVGAITAMVREIAPELDAPIAR